MSFAASDARIELLDRRLTERLEQLTKSIDALAVQVAQTNSVVKQTSQNIDKLTDRIDSHLKVAEKQADNIAELTKIVATQANTVAMLISRTS